MHTNYRKVLRGFSFNSPHRHTKLPLVSSVEMGMPSGSYLFVMPSAASSSQVGYDDCGGFK